MRSITFFTAVLVGCAVGVLGCDQCPSSSSGQDHRQYQGQHLHGAALAIDPQQQYLDPQQQYFEPQQQYPSNVQGYYISDEIEHLTAPHDEDGAIIREEAVDALPQSATSALSSLLGTSASIPTGVLSLVPTDAAQRSAFLINLESALPTAASERASLISEVLKATDKAGVESVLGDVLASATGTGEDAKATGESNNEGGDDDAS
ncbi:hypothetical protein BZA05DRAFT_419115, partial [Tricharina praecox]|uniref:uncharacterized protein n=1 Tax=Tricharina praecox TaxID=43433 RepID=UPI00221E692C